MPQKAEFPGLLGKVRWFYFRLLADRSKYSTSCITYLTKMLYSFFTVCQDFIIIPLAKYYGLWQHW